MKRSDCSLIAGGEDLLKLGSQRAWRGIWRNLSRGNDGGRVKIPNFCVEMLWIADVADNRRISRVSMRVLHGTGRFTPVETSVSTCTRCVNRRERWRIDRFWCRCSLTRTLYRSVYTTVIYSYDYTENADSSGIRYLQMGRHASPARISPCTTVSPRRIDIEETWWPKKCRHLLDFR